MPRLMKLAVQQPELLAVSVKIGYSALGIPSVEWRLLSSVSCFAWTFRQGDQEITVLVLNRRAGRASHEALLDYISLHMSSPVLRKN